MFSESDTLSDCIEQQKQKNDKTLEEYVVWFQCMFNIPRDDKGVGVEMHIPTFIKGLTPTYKSVQRWMLNNINSFTTFDEASKKAIARAR